MNIFDVIVLGGGPAGMAAALALVRRGVSVVVIERSHYEYQRIGETLPPQAKKVLASLDVWERFLRQRPSPSFDIRSAWGASDLYSNDFILSPYGCGWHVDRARFDCMLAEAAREAGAGVFLGVRAMSCKPKSWGNWQVDISSAGKLSSIQARRLVDATGRSSLLGLSMGARRLTYDRLVGIVGFFKEAGSTCRCNNSTLIEAVRSGWWYSARLPDSRIVVAFMTDGDLYAEASEQTSDFWQKQLRSTCHIYERVKDYTLDSGLCVRSANTSRLDPMAGDNWLAVGDSAMTFDPLSAQGIIKALESGLHAAAYIEASLAGKHAALRDYASKAKESFESYFHSRRIHYSRERRWPDHPFWRRRAAAKSFVPPQSLTRLLDTTNPALQPQTVAMDPASRFSRIIAQYLSSDNKSLR